MTPTGARSLALWLARTSPSIYAAMLAKATHAHGLGGCGCSVCSSRLGALGQDDEFDLSSVTTTDDSVPEIDIVSPDPLGSSIASAATQADFPTLFDTVTPDTLQQVSLNPDALTPAAPVTTDDTSTSAPSTIASTASSALSAVGSYLASPAGVSSLLQVGTAALKAQAASDNAKTATAVLQAQVARTVAGGNPAAISYQVNPATGALTPILTTSTGTPALVTGSLLGALAPGAGALQVNTFLAQYGVWIAGAVLLLLLVSKGES